MSDEIDQLNMALDEIADEITAAERLLFDLEAEERDLLERLHRAVEAAELDEAA